MVAGEKFGFTLPSSSSKTPLDAGQARRSPDARAYGNVP